jgi:hypothetical protein
MRAIAKCSALLLVASLGFVTYVFADDTDGPSLTNPLPPLVPAPEKDLSKDETDSCNALLCLEPDGKSQLECQDPLRKLQEMKPHKRQKFLDLCPKG